MENPWENEKRNCFPELEAICPKCGSYFGYSEDAHWYVCQKCGAEYQFNDVAWREYHFNKYGEVIGYTDHKGENK